ncbi:MAG: hypothetical protein JXQ91_07470 [Vannielia sp.]|uniref:hypothetical protein n=1 Tax=Vannielia sp. TaxID=2813045 RepID=UPI003B8BDABE
MTLDDARKMCPIMATVDSGCSVCVEGIVDEMNEAFPSFRWTIDDLYSDPPQISVVYALEPVETDS